MFFEVLVCLLGKHGVAINDVNVKKTGEVKIDIDFSEHDNVFEDKIAEQKNEISMLKSLIDNYRDAESKLFDENQELKKQVERLRKDNVKLTDALTYEIERKSNEIKNTQVHPDLEWYEKRIDDDSIEINKLNTTIDVLIHRCEYLRQMAGLE